MSKNQPLKPGGVVKREQVFGVQDDAEIQASFETGEQGDYKIQFPQKVKIVKIVSRVVKALAATDAGTITAKNNAGTAMASGILTHAASAAFGDEQTVSPTTNNILAAGENLILTTAKTTAGGKVSVVVHAERQA